ncbi:TPA: hypothetical protein G4H70_001888 [Salmonella enterica subsp. enterica serovar Infantis]|nr:hypothetical protein [Salmonella enterica subsp. enterica serovar Infantis]ECD1187135.1 hypothetical protein [Salmonella enterica subsp. enterica serovar Infantis]ECG7210405.1 hypothetical protein [Salmonella enterica subsp. enterica serovar Infantis]HAE2960919.1 hypothetical protein [Salmonella enterica subsp. enterica serovar Infantis]HAM2257811.1 hypothetical protein [Salmonella enterica subsp. enterica serovar Infantis]
MVIFEANKKHTWNLGINELLVFVDRMQSDIFSAPEFVARPKRPVTHTLSLESRSQGWDFFVFNSCRYWRAE